MLLSDANGQCAWSFTAGYDVSNFSQNKNSLNRPNGLVTEFGWYAASDGANALALREIHHKQGAASVSKHGYHYDLAGRIKSWSRQLDAVPANKKDWSLAYSRGGELETMVEKNATNVETARAYWSYDAAGNWYASGTSTATTHCTHDSMNRLNQIGGAGKTVVEGVLDEPAAVMVNGQKAKVMSMPGTSDFSFQREIPVTEGENDFSITATDAQGNARTQNYQLQVGAAQRSFSYDANGNMTNNGAGQTYQWDAENRLVKIIYADLSSTEFAYDGLSRRSRITEKNASGVAISDKRYVWSGGNQPAEERDATTNAVTKRFFEEGEQRIGGADAGFYYYAKDHLGSIREITNSTGAIAARYDFDLWGKRTKLSGTFESEVGYTGHHHHAKSGLILTWYRAYDAELGRWLSADPIGEEGGLNLYGYVGNDPLGAWDPDGLSKKTASWILATLLRVTAGLLDDDPASLAKGRSLPEKTEVQSCSKGSRKKSRKLKGLAALGGIGALSQLNEADANTFVDEAARFLETGDTEALAWAQILVSDLSVAAGAAVEQALMDEYNRIQQNKCEK